MAIQETNILKRTLLDYSKRGYKLWRNHRGVAYHGKAVTLENGDVLLKGAYRVTFGVGPNGASDLMGFLPVVITQEMVGTTIAKFVVVEIKTDKGTVTEEQQRFVDTINKFGGEALIVAGMTKVHSAPPEPFNPAFSPATLVGDVP